jgi:hypothetical protein
MLITFAGKNLLVLLISSTYSVDFGGSQEEEVATNCDGAAILGTTGDLMVKGFKTYSRGIWVAYGNKRHIPPGGNYFAKTKFVTGPTKTNCAMIAAAFADFRPYVPFFVPYSERNYFYSWFGFGSISNEEELEKRLIMDIEGVLKTCIEQNVHTLVTGASGCGAFLHDPYREAKLWQKAMQKPEYQSKSLKQIVFAVLDKVDSDNWLAFSELFG